MKILSLGPSKHFLFSKTSRRRLEDVFSVAISHLPQLLQDVVKMSSRHLRDIFVRQLPKISCHDVLEYKEYYAEDVFSTFSTRFYQDECLQGSILNSGSGLFHSIMTEEDKVLLRNICLTLKWGILFAFLEEYGLLILGKIHVNKTWRSVFQNFINEA